MTVTIAITLLCASIASALVTVWLDKINDVVRNPFVMIALTAITIPLSLPTLFIYEITPWVPKPRFMRHRVAARRLRRRVQGATDFHLPSSAHAETSSVALIVRLDAEVADLEACEPELTRMYLEELAREGLQPRPDWRPPRVHIVSHEAIKRGGGPFHFWREWGLY